VLNFFIIIEIIDDNSIRNHCDNYNSIILKNIYQNDVKNINTIFSPNLFTEYKEYKSKLLFPDKVINKNIPFVSSETINYVIINYYYKYFHPIYPIIDYNYFALHAKNGTLTKHLLYAMYGMAYFMKPESDNNLSLNYINEVKSLISQNYNDVNVQLLQAIILISIYGMHLCSY